MITFAAGAGRTVTARVLGEYLCYPRMSAVIMEVADIVESKANCVLLSEYDHVRPSFRVVRYSGRIGNVGPGHSDRYVSTMPTVSL